MNVIDRLKVDSCTPFNLVVFSHVYSIHVTFCRTDFLNYRSMMVFFDFSLTVKAAPHECVMRTGQP